MLPHAKLCILSWLFQSHAALWPTSSQCAIKCNVQRDCNIIHSHNSYSVKPPELKHNQLTKDCTNTGQNLFCLSVPSLAALSDDTTSRFTIWPMTSFFLSSSTSSVTEPMSKIRRATILLFLLCCIFFHIWQVLVYTAKLKASPGLVNKSDKQLMCWKGFGFMAVNLNKIKGEWCRYLTAYGR